MENFNFIKICGINMLWVFKDKRINDYFQYVMPDSKYIVDKDIYEIQYTVNIINKSEEKYKNKNDCIKFIHNKKAKLFIYKFMADVFIDYEKIREPESLYYFLINPLLMHVFTFFHKLYLHGACIGIKENGVAILGPSNSGKTTLSILALLNGYNLLTDDCFYIEEDMIAESYYRPLHIHPNLGSKLKINDKLRECEPYMQDVVELNYRMEKYHPKQTISKQLVNIIIFPFISADEEKCELIKIEDKKKKIELIKRSFGYLLNHNSSLSLIKVLDSIYSLPSYELVMGEDIFIDSKKIFSIIEKIL